MPLEKPAIKSIYTMTGYEMGEAIQELMEILPPRAYKAVPGAAKLTDISPAYLTEKLTRVFGPVGIGWFYDYNSNDVSTTILNKTSSTGREYTEYSTTITKLEFYYNFTNADGSTIQKSHPIVANGSSDNENPGYAVRGALTSAIGAAASKLCWQLLVYKDILDHSNAEQKYKDQQARKSAKVAESGNDNESAKEQSSTETTKKVPAASKKTNAVANTEPTPPADTAPAKSIAAEAVKEGTLEWALSVIIPDNLKSVPIRGKSFRQVMEDKVFGEGMVKFLSGSKANMSGEYFLPQTDDEKVVHQAAKLIFEHSNKK